MVVFARFLHRIVTSPLLHYTFIALVIFFSHLYILKSQNTKQRINKYLLKASEGEKVGHQAKRQGNEDLLFHLSPPTARSTDPLWGFFVLAAGS